MDEMKPAVDTKVHVIVNQKPQKVWVVCNDQIHSARWRTAGSGELRDVTGNAGLLRAALLAWDGQETFTTTFAELEKRSQGWGAWNEDE